MITSDPAIEGALRHGHLVDITTIGRRTGEPRRIELVFHNLGGRIFITGRPGWKQRDWIANLTAEPRFTFHLKGPVTADLHARARVITDADERARLIPVIVAQAGWPYDVSDMIETSPLIEVAFD